jgi:hypothetical protein
MKPFRLLALFVVASAAVAAAAPSSAAAAGGPIITTAVPGDTGIESADGQFRYVTLDGDGSIVASVIEGTGEVDASTPIDDPDGGYFGIPQVALDGSASGLSADGGTLVLIRSAGPIDQAKLIVLGTNKLRILNRITLKGQYSFDAISPDGRTAYVVEYPRRFRYDRYRVLKLDLQTGRLAKDPITDEDVGLEEEGEEAGGVEGEMRGLALSRVSSDDGRWAYTLYDGGGDTPFIHALDTVGDKAVCIFMPQLDGVERKQIAKASIATGPEPGTISVIGREDHESSELARVDTTSFAVTTPASEVSESGAGMTAPLILAGTALAGLGLGAVLLLRRRRAGQD